MNSDLDKLMNVLSESGIVSSQQLDELKGQLDAEQTLQTVEAFVEELVRQGHLTKYQADEVCRGKAEQLILGDYLLIDQIGRGGLGQVYRARHAMMNREVAIKVLRPEAAGSIENVQRFRREVEAAGMLSHTNIISAFDAGKYSGHYYLVMEFVRGQDLRTTIHKEGPLPVRVAVQYLLQAASGLEYAHSRGVIHRDVKPSNLLLTDENQVKVLDLGLSRLVLGDARFSTDTDNPTEITETGSLMGTVDFMAPEQALHAHDVDYRCDIYGLGCTLYFLLTGKPPYEGDSLMKKLIAHREDPVPKLSINNTATSKLINDLLELTLAKNPDHRFENMSELRVQLERALTELPEFGDMPDTIRVDSKPHRPSALSGRRLAGMLLGAVLLVAIGGALTNPQQLLSWIDRSRQPPVVSGKASKDRKEKSTQTDILPMPDISKPFHPLDWIDLPANIIAGEGWHHEDSVLRTGTGHALLQLPVPTPEEYSVSFDVTRLEGRGPLVIGLRIADHQCYLLIDAARPNGDRISAFGVDQNGRLTNSVHELLLEPNQTSEFLIQVTPESIEVSVDSRSAMEWRGSSKELKVGGGWRVPIKTALFIGTNDQAVFDLKNLTVSPASQDEASATQPVEIPDAKEATE